MEHKTDGAGQRQWRVHNCFRCISLHTFHVFSALNTRVVQGNSLELSATASTTSSSDPCVHHPTSNTLYGAHSPTPAQPPPAPSSSSHAPQVNSGMIAGILIRRRDPHSKHVPLVGAAPEPTKDNGNKKK
jgi:hypothetical protein